MKKTILVGAHPNEIGGISTFIKNILKINPEKFDYFSNSRFVFLKTQNSFINKSQKFLYSIYNNLRFILFLLKNKNIESVIVVTPSKYAFFDSIYYILVSKIFKKKTYLRYAGDLMNFYKESNFLIRKSIKLGLEIPYKNIVQSQKISKFIKEEMQSDAKIEILPEVIMSIQEQENHISEIINFVFFGGSEAKRKGSTEVIDSIIEINKTKNNFQFYLVAIPEIQEKKIKQFNFKNITIIDKIYGTNKDNLMKKINVLLLPSYKEGMPNAILDALSYGMGIITTQVGSIPEVLKKNKNTFFVSAGNVQELSNAIKKYSDNNILKFQSKNNIQLAEKYSQDNFKDRLNEILQ